MVETLHDNDILSFFNKAIEYVGRGDKPLRADTERFNCHNLEEALCHFLLFFWQVKLSMELWLLQYLF